MSATKFSKLVVGTMRLGQWGAKYTSAEMERFIDQCLDLGLYDFDHADIYGGYTSEGEFGDVLKRRKDLVAKTRHTTKCGIRMISENRPDHKIKSYDSSARHIRWSVENSLKELGVECLDHLLLHRPDYLMDVSEVAEVFTALRKEGKVRHFGVSNFTTSQLDLLHSIFPLNNHQIEISPLHTDAFENGTLDQCQKHGIIPTAWSPLSGGAFFAADPTDQVKRLNKVLNALSETHGVSFSSILFAWLQNHPTGIVPVTGTSKIERIKEALAACDIVLTRAQWYEIWEASKGREVA